MNIQFILQNVLRVLTDDSLILVPCLYVILWALRKTPRVRNTVWLYTWIILAAGVVFSGLLSGFSVYGMLRGMLAAGVAEYLYQTNEKKQCIKCTPCKREANKRNKSPL